LTAAALNRNIAPAVPTVEQGAAWTGAPSTMDEIWRWSPTGSVGLRQVRERRHLEPESWRGDALEALLGKLRK